MRAACVVGSVLVTSVATASMYPRSRGVGDPVVFAFSIEAFVVSPTLSFFNPPNGLPQPESAIPQYAIAQFASLARMPLNILMASGNQNECRSATALLNSAFTAAAHDV